MQNKPRLGISSCLLGHNVRYDGGHKLDRFIANTLSEYVQFVPVCPEVECGLPVPRPAMRLVGDPESPRLQTIKEGRDLTLQMQEWAQGRLQELEKEGLCGFIFKSRSPSSGMSRVKVYQENGHPVPKGVGIWARMFMEHFPLLAFEEDGRLNDPRLRENFIQRVFVFKRLQEFLDANKTRQGLVQFHAQHKLILMAHSPQLNRQMGRLVAEADKLSEDELFHSYFVMLSKALSLLSTNKKNTNVLQHIQGYFKKDLSSSEKQELSEIIEQYRQEVVPLIVPVTLLKHFSRKYNKQYLLDQYYLDPHPIELKLRNHV